LLKTLCLASLPLSSQAYQEYSDDYVPPPTNRIG